MEVVIRAAAVYTLLWVVLRAMGKRELADMTAFRTRHPRRPRRHHQKGVTQEDMSVTGAGLAVCTMALLAVGTSVIGRRFPWTQSLIEGRSSVVVRDGKVLDDVLEEQRITTEELHEAARKRGYLTLDALAWVIVEADGNFSFIEKSAENGGDSSGSDDSSSDDEGEPHI